MLAKLVWRMFTTTAPMVLVRFCLNFVLEGMVAVKRFHRRIGQGRQFPPFLFLSITNRCNLNCQGCWVTTSPPYADLDLATIDRVIAQSSRAGTRFFGIMGGEPLLHPDTFDVFRRHPRCYFQLFTNGILLTRDVARRLRQLGNVTPLISVEGSEVVSDVRRGGEQVFARTLDGVAHCVREGLVTGVATSVCKSNIDDLISEKFLDRLIDLGVHYVWYYAYRPTGANPCPELALSADELVTLRRFIVEMRCTKPIVIVDTYYDEEGHALCPAAHGMSYHVNPWGDVEPCPPIQFAVENVQDSDDVVTLIDRSKFLRDFREFAAAETKGCVLLEHPDHLREFVETHGARDTTGRGTGLAELEARCPLCSQHVSGREVPEKHPLYRFAKKHWFFGFGGYA